MPEDRHSRRSRSRSPGPSQRPPRDYAAASSAASSTSSSSRSSVWPANATTSAPPSAPGRHADPQASTGSSSPLSQLFVGGSSLPEIPNTPHSVARDSAHLLRLSSRPESAQNQQSPYNSAGMFNQARNFIVTGGTFVDNSVTYNDMFSNQFMKDLLGETIRGAEFDSSDRDPPPRCQPGTRLAVLERCLSFISNCDGTKKVRWVVGAAGVGKSAIMQSVAESPVLPVSSPASVFFSINGRDDGTRAIVTLSYQFAVKSDSYRQVIAREITHDPSLLRSSMAKQFNKLIIEPFIHNPQLKSAGRVLVIIDGLDECKDHRTQLELLRLISDLCLTYPTSPLVWLIASRPESHITSFFSKRNVIPAYEKEEIPINSDEARADVEQFLRAKFTELKDESDSLDSRWPEEWDFWKVAYAAGGLFAYAETVMRYISDSRVGSPVSQLSDVLYLIDKHSMTDVSREEHPMALLDALYERILLNVPPKIMINTRKLLLALASDWDAASLIGGVDTNFIVLCNWLGITADEAYAAVNHLRSILYIPPRDKAHKESLAALHKSFIDYISDPTRSRFSLNLPEEVRQLRVECTFRMLTKVPDGVNLDDFEVHFTYGKLASGPLALNKMPLTWLIEETGGWDNNTTRLNVYKLTIVEVVRGLCFRPPTPQSLLCIRFLTTMWKSYSFSFPSYELLSLVFDETRRLELMKHGILKRISLKDSDVALVSSHGLRRMKLQFYRPATSATNLSDPWNSSCQHVRKGDWEVGKALSWTTTFVGFLLASAVGSSCIFCYKRFHRHLENWKSYSPDDTALVVFTSGDHSCAQVRLVDPEDGVSEWTYSFWCSIPWEVRKKYLGAV